MECSLELDCGGGACSSGEVHTQHVMTAKYMHRQKKKPDRMDSRMNTVRSPLPTSQSSAAHSYCWLHRFVIHAPIFG